jgi:AcrR family transcriptional regulator
MREKRDSVAPRPQGGVTGRAAERRELVLAAARKLFLRRGYDGTTVVEIARRAGFSKRTVYLDFPSKHEVFGAVLAPELERLRGLLGRAVEGRRDGRLQTRALALAYADFALTEPEIFAWVMTLERRDFYRGRSLEGLGFHARRCLELNEAMSRMADAALARGLEDGSVRSQLAVPQLNLLIWAGLVGILEIARGRAGVLGSHYRITPRQLIEELVGRLLPPVGDEEEGDGCPERQTP